MNRCYNSIQYTAWVLIYTHHPQVNAALEVDHEHQNGIEYVYYFPARNTVRFRLDYKEPIDLVDALLIGMPVGSAEFETAEVRQDPRMIVLHTPDAESSQLLF